MLVRSIQTRNAKTEYVYLVRGGVSPGLRATDYKDPPKILEIDHDKEADT